jgi:hypothetical protein
MPEIKPLPKDCQAEAIELINSQSRAVTLVGLSVKIFVFELEEGFQILHEDEEGIMPWYAIEELKEIMDWLAQFRIPLSGNEEFDFDNLWSVLLNKKDCSLIQAQT